MHPQFLEIMALLVEYRDGESPETVIEVNTNGFGRRVNQLLDRLPSGVVIKNSMKTSNVQPLFSTFNVSPRDVPDYDNADYSNGCWITERCGTGVTPYGYYPCAVAGGIDRIFGFDLGRKTLPKADDNMEAELRKFCSVCGHFKRRQEAMVDGPVMSTTWKQAYANAKAEGPHLSRLPEAGVSPELPDRTDCVS